MQGIDCGTLYEVEPGLFLPPGDRRVRAEVRKQRALGFRHEGVEEMAAGIGRLKSPPLQPYRDRDRRESPLDIFEQHRRVG